MKNQILRYAAIIILFVFFVCVGCGTKTPSTGSSGSALAFQNENLSFNYGSEWIINGKTESSVVLTHKERPGDVLLSAHWFEDKVSKATDIAELYKNQLDLLATDIQRLESINIGNIHAERYASSISRSGEESVVTLHVLFNSKHIFYLVTFSASPSDFVAYTASAGKVIDSIKVK